MTRAARFLLLSLLAACGGSQDGDNKATAGESTAQVAASATPGATAPVEGDKAAPAANPAPDFTLADLDGNKFMLSSFRGKTVVLEWFNPGCPFVRYSHGEGPLRELAKQHTASGIVWLSINSGAKGKQGNGADINKQAREEFGMENPILIDEDGQVGKAYGAKTTPHIFVIDPRGSIVYQGALDNAPLGKAPSDGQVNYVNDALAAMAAGKSIEVSETKPYGCSVKYSE